MDAITSQTFFRREPRTGDEVPICVRRSKAAEMLDISVSTLDRLVKAGDIPSFKLAGGVLFRVEALRDWAQRQEYRATRSRANSGIPSEPMAAADNAAMTPLR